jgi:hypothetical protein
MMRYLAATAAAFTLTAAAPTWAAEPTSQPVALTDQELDQVTAGEGALLDVFAPINISLQDISVTVAINNVPVNAGLAVQLNALGTAAQTASVTSFQSVTQVSTIAP